MRDLPVARLLAVQLLVASTLAGAAGAQPVQATADRVLWELAAWPGVDPDANPQTQATSGEDWFFSITPSVTAVGARDGFVSAGYSTFPEIGSTTCASGVLCGSPYGCSLATISKVSPGGEVEWFHTNGHEGNYWRVINTSDGGFLAVGGTLDRPDFPYNPVSSSAGATLLCGSHRLMMVSRYHHDGTPDWEYAYGHMVNPDDHRPGGTLQLQERHDYAWDAVERPDGGFRIVGHAVDPETGMNPRAFVMDLDPNGGLVDSQVYGTPGDRSELMGIARWGDEYVAVGTQYNGAYTASPYGDVFVIKLGETLTEEPLESRLLTDTADDRVQNTGFDVAYAGDGTVHVGAILDCLEGGRGQCFRDEAGGVGEAVVFRLNEDLTDRNTVPTSLGEVRAYDLFVRLTATSDGGVALVSTVQPTEPPYGYPEWYFTDAFVARPDTAAAVVWMSVHDARTNMASTDPDYPGFRGQECLYDIAEAEDGGLAISGNNSSYLDDSYVVRFAPISVPTLPAPTVAHSHLVYPVLGLVPNTLELSGDLTVAPTGRVWVETGRTLAFQENATLMMRGELVTGDATLTAIDEEDPWDGIVVARAGALAELNSGTVVEYAGAGVAVYAPGRVHTTDATLRENGVGLAVYSDGADSLPGALVEDSGISDNGIGVVTDFTCTWDSGPAPTCSGLISTRSSTWIFGTDITNNKQEGVLALATDAQMMENEVEGNGDDGISLASTTLNPFLENTVLDNGGYGVGVLASGEFFGSPFDDFGENTISTNGSAEVWVHNSGFAHLGSNSSNGRNAVSDPNGGLLLRYAALVTPALEARYQWWGTSSVNPGSMFSGSVSYCPFYTCNPVGNPSCTQTACDQVHVGTTSVRSVDVDGGTRRTGPIGREGSPATTYWTQGEPLEDVGAAIRSTRGLIAASPSDEAAPGRIRWLGYLHILDHDDATGEREDSFSLLAQLRESLAATTLPAGIRSSAEAALEVEAAAALAREDYATANALLDTYRSCVQDEVVRRHLTLTQAFLLAREARRDEAAFLVAGVAASVNDPEEARALYRLADALATMPGHAIRARATINGLATPLTSTTATSGDEVGLTVSPNPVRGRATVTIGLASDERMRLAVYDVLGREVLTLIDGTLSAGAHNVVLDAVGLRPGLYLLRGHFPDRARTLTQRLTVAE